MVPTRRHRVLEVVACSLLVTGLAALVGLGVAATSDVRWNYAFVITRWIFIFGFILAAAVGQVAERRGATWSIPWVVRTPATVLLLMVESIGFDIISAQLH